MAKPVERFYVKPVLGPKSIRDPLSLQFLPEEGDWKPKNTYWLRRVKFNDVVEAKQLKQPKHETFLDLEGTQKGKGKK